MDPVPSLEPPRTCCDIKLKLVVLSIFLPSQNQITKNDAQYPRPSTERIADLKSPHGINKKLAVRALNIASPHNLVRAESNDALLCRKIVLVEIQTVLASFSTAFRRYGIRFTRDDSFVVG